MNVIKLVLLSAFIGVTFQDLKERAVYWFLFPVIGICAGILMYQETLPSLFFETIVTNLLFVGLLIGGIYVYATYKLKIKLSDAFGLGDGLLFVALVFSFAPLTFIVVFVFGLLCSLLLHMILKKSKAETVPLAGYMSLFFVFVFCAHWTGNLTTVYIL